MEWEKNDWLGCWVAEDIDGNTWFVTDCNDMAYLGMHDISLSIGEKMYTIFPHLPVAKEAMDWVDENHINYLHFKMSKFYVDYGTGECNELVDGSVDDAKRIAVEGVMFTQKDVTILDEGRNEVARLPWYGVIPSEDDIVIARFGSLGFYGDWLE